MRFWNEEKSLLHVVSGVLCLILLPRPTIVCLIPPLSLSAPHGLSCTQKNSSEVETHPGGWGLPRPLGTGTGDSMRHLPMTLRSGGGREGGRGKS